MKLSFRRLALVCSMSVTLAFTGCFPEDHYLDRDVRDDVFYFVMPDRFENGDLSNDLGGLSGDKMIHGFDLFDKGMYHGGDMAGLEARLDYLKDLGITAIWMTPILKNQAMQGDSAAYHGYWTLDFTQIDPHLGSNEDLQSLIDAAHDRNMKVFFDIITNHTADVIKYEECHNPDGTSNGEPCSYVSLEEKAAGNGLTPFIPAGMEDAKVPAWLNDPKYYNNQGDSTFSGENSEYGDFSGLDDIDTRQPEVVAGMIDIFKNIVSDFKPDGFRIDTVKHVNLEFWQEFSPAILEHAHSEGIPNFFMFGEVYDGNPQYLSTFTTVGKLQSVLDFGIQGAASSVFAGNGSSQALADLFAQDDVYTDADSDASLLMNFGGNHDMGRIGMFIENSQPNASEEEKLARAKLFNAFMFFARGIPVIYYGDEQGFTGDGGDKDAREDMFPSSVASYNDNNLIGTSASVADDNFDPSHPLYESIASYADIYKQHDGLRYGSHVNRYAESDGGLYAFSRIDDRNREYLVVFNASNTDRMLTLQASAAKYFPVVGSEKLKRDKAGNIEVHIGAFDFAIYKANQAAKTSPRSEFEIVGAESGSAVAGRVDIALSLAQPLSVLPTYEASFEVSYDQGQTFHHLATDSSAPYQLMWPTQDLADGTQVVLKASLDNGRGKVTTNEISLVIDSRVPETVTVDYENGNERNRLYVANQQGTLQGPIVNSGNGFSFAWDENSDQNLLYFVDKSGDQFEIDAPILIDRATIVGLSTENAEGQLDASIFVNNLGELSLSDNDVGGVAAELELISDAPAPYGSDINVRGGLNSWGADAMAYVGNQTYKLTRFVEKGDVEFKFADSNWSPVNIGGPVSQNGLLLGSNPGNLVHHFDEATAYSFYLVSTEYQGSPVILHFIEKEIGPVGETIFIKGDMNGWGNENPFTYLGGDQYQANMTLAPGQYGFKLANESWSWERVIADGNVDLDVAEPVQPTGANISLTLDQLADVTFTYVFDESLTVTAKIAGDLEPSFSVYFQKPAHWGETINLYHWNSSPAPATQWPGEPMISLGDSWYQYTFADGVTSANLIFNDGSGNQTADLMRETEGCYSLDTGWVDSCNHP
ncbi:starch-binding protein [Reinekea forsetii]|nr:starch-binding protein [Reinekea forsetii]